jgi:hypothetical protein
MSKKDMLNRDGLIVSWIKEVFNPQRMLEYFVAIMNNLHEDDTVQRIWDDTFTEDCDKHNSAGIDEKGKHISTAKDGERTSWIDDDGNKFYPKDASDMRTERWMTFLLTSEKPSFYDISNKPYYELDIDIISKIMQVLEKKYNIYYKCIIQTIKNCEMNRAEDIYV